MAVNDRLTNERMHEWEKYFQELKKKEERENLLTVLEKGVIIDRSLGDFDIRLNCTRSNASEEFIVQYDGSIYYIIAENEECDDRILICEEVKEVF